MKTLLKNGWLVNEGQIKRMGLVVDADRISYIGDKPEGQFDKVVDATGCYILPGVIDEHVHFREPGLTQKADIESESRAAAFGGVTSFFDMPNTSPATTSIEAWQDKMAHASRESHVNYAFFFGATGNNFTAFKDLDRTALPGIKLFMGASTGNMQVEGGDTLRQIFMAAAQSDLPLMTHCEDTGLIKENMNRCKAEHGADPDISFHPLIRSAEACYRSTLEAVDMARQCGTRLHVAHISTARELELFGQDPQITAEAVLPHLIFSVEDYKTKGALIKCNPAVKTAQDRAALRCALSDGRIRTIGTDHAPHRLQEKQGGAARALSGMPMLQFSLPSMLGLVDEKVLTLPRMVELMSHNPALLFSIRDRGFIRPDYKADLTIVRPQSPWTLTEDLIQSKCGWSPLTGHKFNWQVVQTICNGHLLLKNEHELAEPDYRGEAILFR